MDENFSNKESKFFGEIFFKVQLFCWEKSFKEVSERFQHFKVENFSGVKIVKSKDWFLPKEMEGVKGKMNELKSKNYINFDEKFGKIICKTSIAVCKKPKNIE